MASYTIAVFQAYSNIVFLLKKDKRFYVKSMKGIVVTVGVKTGGSRVGGPDLCV